MTQQNRNPRGEAGFTLIEIAIVLVIIGLLLGGVLQGQQLIENSRVRSATNDINGIAAGAFSYQDRYGRLPGDDPGATNDRGSSWPRTENAGDGNGVVEGELGATFDPAENSEVAYFFQDLRSAGFINGDPSLSGTLALPQNPFGGLTSITNEPVMATDGGSALGGMKVCMSNVTGSAATALDNQLDDGIPGSGRFRAHPSSAGTDGAPDGNAATNSYDEDLAYTTCYRI